MLLRIVERVRADLDAAPAEGIESLRRRALRLPAPPDFRAALRPAAVASGTRIIAEIKRASPSRGHIREVPDPAALALDLQHSGAAALSIITERHYFGGDPLFLQQAAAAVSIPVLRKDFIIDARQVVEARLWGAAAVLLIAALLEDDTLELLLREARACGLQALVEVHNREELERVLALDAPVVGVNSRDLHSFTIDLRRASRLLASIPPARTRVAESGIRSRDDARRLAESGADALLVGERLMSSGDPAAALAELRE